MLIAIEGIDGSGKGTQARELLRRLRAAGRSAALLSFPRYADTLFGGLIGDYLNGRLGTLEQVPPLLASLLFAGDRFESLGVLQEALERHDVVILDRYVASNVAHQAARAEPDSVSPGPAPCGSVVERGSTASATGPQAPALLADLIQRIEYDIYGLPRADRTILLDLPVETAVELIARKKPRGYTEQAADLHEADVAYLEAVRQMYRQLAAADPGWRIVPVTQSGAVRPIADISDDILAACGLAGA